MYEYVNQLYLYTNTYIYQYFIYVYIKYKLFKKNATGTYNVGSKNFI